MSLYMVITAEVVALKLAVQHIQREAIHYKLWKSNVIQLFTPTHFHAYKPFKTKIWKTPLFEKLYIFCHILGK